MPPKDPFPSLSMAQLRDLQRVRSSLNLFTSFLELISTSKSETLRINFLCLFTSLFLFATPLFSQDLIERTRIGVQQISSNTTPNELAKLVARSATSSRSGSSVDLFEVQSQAQNRFNSFASDAVLLNLKGETLEDFWRSKAPSINLNIPVDETNAIDLELVQVELYDTDFSFTTSDDSAMSEAEIGVYYRGIVSGDVQSIVSVSVFEKNIRIIIGDDDGNYVLGRLGTSNDHVLYNDRKLFDTNPFSCGVTDNLSIVKEKTFNNDRLSTNSRSSMNTCIPIYVECDFKTFQDFGSDLTLVNEYVGSLVNEAATVYANEQIEISLSEVKVWTTPDPYANLNSTSDILEKFGETVKDDFNGRLAHWISTRNLGGGVAWLDVLCDNYFTFPADFDGDGVNELHHAGPYAVSAGLGTSITAYPTYSWDVGVFVHEMGHNLGSPHTQACSWEGGAIDGCVATEGGNLSLIHI